MGIYPRLGGESIGSLCIGFSRFPLSFFSLTDLAMCPCCVAIINHSCDHAEFSGSF